MSFKLRFSCTGPAPSTRVKTDPLAQIWLDRQGRFIVDYTGGTGPSA